MEPSRYSYVRQSYKPIVLLSVSISLHLVSIIPLSLFQRSLALQMVEPSQQQDYSYRGQEQCVLSPTLFRTIDTLVKISVLVVLLFVGLLIRWSRPVIHQSLFWQDYRHCDQDQCIVSSTFCRIIKALVKSSV